MSKGKVYSPVQRFFNLLKPDNRDIRNVYIFSAFRGLLNLSLPVGIQAILNFIQGGQVNAAYILLSSLVILGISAMGVFQILQLKIMERIQQRVFSRAAFEFAYRISKIKLEALYQKYAPELMNRFFDVPTVQKGLAKILIDFATAVLYIVFGLILLTIYHPFFILFSVVLVAAVIVLIRVSGKTGMETSFKESTYKYSLVHWLEELARVSTTFKLAGKTDLHLKRTDQYVTSYLKQRDRHFKVLVSQYVVLVAFKIIVALGVLVVGGIIVMKGEMTIGQFVAAEIILLLLISSIEKVIISLEHVYDILTALEKIAQVTDLELDFEEGIDMKLSVYSKGVAVKANDLKYYFPMAKKYAIRDLSFELNPGETLMLLGRNGAGKSTLLNLLTRLYESKGGFINYDGIPINKISNHSFRDMVGASVKKASVFEGTIYENLVVDRDGLSEEYVMAVLDRLGLGKIIRELPEDIHSLITGEGANFNKGFIQKLLIAREIISRPRLLILEDPFKNMYTEDRKELIDFLISKENNWTLIATSPNEYFFENCDKVLVLEEGSLLFFGTPDQFKKDYQDYKQYINA